MMASTDMAFLLSKTTATLIWFKIWGSWIRVKEISIFPGKFLKNFNFSQAILPKNSIFQADFGKNRFFQAISQQKISIFCLKIDFFRQFHNKKFRFSRQ